jgi:hypothetical protein
MGHDFSWWIRREKLREASAADGSAGSKRGSTIRSIITQDGERWNASPKHPDQLRRVSHTLMSIFSTPMEIRAKSVFLAYTPNN